MPNITDISTIPDKVIQELRETLATLGPELLGTEWPEELDADSLDDSELARVFESCTRRIWSMQIQDMRVREMVALAASMADSVTDVFDDSGTPAVYHRNKE